MLADDNEQKLSDLNKWIHTLHLTITPGGTDELRLQCSQRRMFNKQICSALMVIGVLVDFYNLLSADV